MAGENPPNVGILGMEVYFPSTYVRQDELEVSMGVSAGKFTIGLGQEEMAFCGDLEDINTISLTVVHRLLEKYQINPMDVGRLEIGTESLIDKSKSTKTILMRLFEGNTDIEGATVTNACYGGTAALLNALAWVDSSAWDGRYAIVVAADIAVYAEGPARPTGGCGAVAMLVGRNAPLAIDLKTRATHAVDVWDFFKPNMDSEYPVVNGALSQTCYLTALDDCYTRFIEKTRKFRQEEVSVENTDYVVFHAPYNKLVQKSFGRMMYQDMMLGSMDNTPVQKWVGVPAAETCEDRELEGVLKVISKDGYKKKVSEACRLSQRIGNTYTASVYMGLSSLVSTLGNSLVDKKVILFSYGSGALATMMRINPRETGHELFNLSNIQKQLDIHNRLDSREKRSPLDLTSALNSRESSHGFVPFTPTFNTAKLAPGTYYLTHINEKYERYYDRKSLNDTHDFAAGLIPSVSTFSDNESDDDIGMSLDEITEIKSNSPRPTLTRNQTYVWANGRPNVKVVVTGTAAALPGRNKDVFHPSHSNISRILDGESFLDLIPDDIRNSMLELNIHETKKNPDGTLTKIPITTFDKNINISASLGKFSLVDYGVSASIVSTMDTAVQVAIACGLEALRDAGLVSGEGPRGWELPESMQKTTGIVYATSFPALDTAIEEVSKFFKSKQIENAHVNDIITGLKKRFEAQSGEPVSGEIDDALSKLQTLLENKAANYSDYEFDRKFLFRLLVLGNAQLAQIVKAYGPNMQTNAACAGSTQAVALGYDLIQVGRAERVIVIAGDNAASDTLLPWVGNGFRSLGAATTASDLKVAAQPFGEKRSGMILGSGGIGMVLESEEGALRRHKLSLAKLGVDAPKSAFKCHLLGTLVSNSAYHGASMDREHIASEMERFFSSVERDLGISRKEIAQNGVYFSHETSTNASPTLSCAANELYGLRTVFGEDSNKLMILNTKGFTGHPMGVSFEDVVAAEVLTTGRIPPIANFTTADPHLGDFKFSTGGEYACKYAIRFAAGFGSQVALALYGV